ncbi:MAG: sigma-70 family RNA polymerase sigma factor, partial [Nanoarchaeota archaeon]|nr:sigma-70 family RNA polymerase sigma factor [Nanoarchaeota archaeon]
PKRQPRPRIPFDTEASHKMDTALFLETDLIQRARQYDRQALAQIYDLYSPGLYRYAMRLLGDSNLAEDCVSETFSRLLGALQRGKGPRDHLQAYLYRIAHNWITDQYRRQPPAEELDENLPNPGEDPESAATRLMRQARLREAIRRLTPDQQQVIALKFLEGWENEEIANALGKPLGAVKSLQHRALENLKRFLLNEDLV